MPPDIEDGPDETQALLAHQYGGNYALLFFYF